MQQGKSNALVLWQWNCRGFRKKRGNLEQFIKTTGSDEAPDVICLQETGVQTKLSNYKSFCDLEEGASGECPKKKPIVATLVRRNLPAVRRDIGEDTTAANHVLVELIPDRKHRGSSIFVLNIYSSPRSNHRFAKLFRKVLDLARGSTIIIVGDFNAHHTEWGYKRATTKGRNLWLDAHQEGFSLVTDSAHPTRMGNSVSDDTTPDLTFTKNTRKEATWLNTHENLGSDHYIITITVETRIAKHNGKQLRIVDWDTFRKIRDAERVYDINDVPLTSDIDDIQEWAEQLHRDTKQATKDIPVEADLYQADAKLLHMWEAKQGLQKRLRKQKLNRNLRRRLAALNRDIENYANQLMRQNWYSTCDSMESQIGLAKTWNLLRCLIDPESSKTTQRHNLSILLHRFEGSDKELIETIRQKYIGDCSAEVLPPYSGTGNETMDRPLTVHEVRGAIHNLRTRSAPGPDGITNKMLRNLDNNSVEALTRYMNVCWERGQIPGQWKTAKVVMIPKSGKKLQIENLRPISLTSCAGKLMEHVILNRINKYMEENGLFPHTMIGFRPKLSTQDVMIRLKHDIIDGAHCSPLDTRAILGIDLTKAFDCVRHTAILENLTKLGLGRRTYDYVSNFLSDRTATLSVGGIQSDTLELGSRGTPQGSVLSPFLFNVAMIGLPELLDNIHGLQYSLYADDVTLWVPGGSDGQIQDTLQRAIEVIETYVIPRGLNCSPEKSALLLYRPTSRGRRTDSVAPDIQLFTCGGQRIPTVSSIRVLGLRIQANGHNSETILALEKSVHQTTRLISRIANRHHGMKEHNLVRLVQAFVISRVTYVAPFLHLKRDEEAKLNAMIRRAYKQAIGIPLTAPTARFEALGLHNTLSEIIEAQRLSQRERLIQSLTGRHILKSLGIFPAGIPRAKIDLPAEIGDRMHIPPLPKNMHPVHNQERRQARAKALHKRYEKSEDVVYVDAADYIARDAMALAVVNFRGDSIASCSVRTTDTEVGEEAAIALAMTASPKIKFIVSDSKSAILNYSRGRISPEASQILKSRSHDERNGKIYLIWAPAHSGLAGNECAHDAARGFTDRAGVDTSDPDAHSLRWTGRDRLVSYRELTTHYRLERARYPPAHPSLSKRQSVVWRLLQTNSYPNPVAYSHCYPGQFSDKCRRCKERADLAHILWACPQATPQSRKISSNEQWETVLLSSDPANQVWAVQLAEDAARTQGLLADA